MSVGVANLELTGMPDRSKVYPARIPPLPLRPSRAGMSRRARVRLAYGLGAAIAAIVAAALLLAVFPPNKTSLLPVGTVAPDFTLHSTGGGVVNLAGLRGKPVLLEFCATWPSPCATETTVLNSLATEPQPPPVISIDGDSENAASVIAFVRYHHVRYGMLLDPGAKTVTFPARGPRGPVTGRYHVTHLPTFYVIDIDGKIVWRFAGTAGVHRLRAELRLASRPVP